MPRNRVVYDSDVGRLDRCSNCKRRIEACVCPPAEQQKLRGGDGIVGARGTRRGDAARL